MQAAQRAGYSEHYSRTKAKVLLAHPEVVAEIQRLRRRMNERAEKSATDVVNEYSKIAFTDRTGFLKEDELRPGSYIYKAPHELTDEQRSIVEKVIVHDNIRVTVIEDGAPIDYFRQEYDYVLSDKANALQQMGRHFGIFDDKLKLSFNQSNPFKNATPEQLEQLRASWVQTMANNGKLIEGEVVGKK